MPVLSNARHEKAAQERAAGKSKDEAYSLAGFKPDKGNAKRLFKRAEVEARVAEIQGKGAELAVVSAATVINELACLGLSNMQDFTSVAPDGKISFDFTKLSRSQLAAVQKIEISDDGKVAKFALYDKRAALADLLRHFTGHPEDRGSTNNVNVQVLQLLGRMESMSDLEIARRVAFALNSAKRMLDAEPAPALEVNP